MQSHTREAQVAAQMTTYCDAFRVTPVELAPAAWRLHALRHHLPLHVQLRGWGAVEPSESPDTLGLFVFCPEIIDATTAHLPHDGLHPSAPTGTFRRYLTIVGTAVALAGTADGELPGADAQAEAHLDHLAHLDPSLLQLLFKVQCAALDQAGYQRSDLACPSWADSLSEQLRP